MIFWGLAFAMAAIAVGLLLPPLLSRGHARRPRRDYDLEVYRDQLAEVKRDQARGLLGEEEAAAARLEIERRLLAAGQGDPEAAEAPEAAVPPRRSAGLAAGLALGVPAAAFGLYLFLGAPQVPSQPLASRTPVPEAGAEMAQLIERLANRLAEAPEDLRGWQLLARSFAQLGRYQEAAEAYGRALALGDESADTWSGLGEALVAVNGGMLVPEARQAFAAALERDPAEVRARFYGGLAHAQDGRMRDALDAWQALAADTPADAPWRGVLGQQIARAQEALGEAPTGAVAPAPGPSAEDVAAAAEMTAEDRNAFIRSMVERLATRLESKPDDLSGWLRLTRAYTVLGERAEAAAALERAAALAAELPAEAPEHGAIARARQALNGMP